MHIRRAISHSHMTYAETVPSWFLLNLKVSKLVKHTIGADQNTGGALLEFPVRTAMHRKSRVSSATKNDFFKLDDSGNCIIRKTWLHCI